MKRFLIVCGILIGLQSAQAQTTDLDTIHIVKRIVMDGDTFFIYEFDEFIYQEFESKEELEEYERLVKRVKKVLPYAKLAAFRLQMMEDNLNQLKTKKARKEYIKRTEKAIKDEFMQPLKDMYVEEGKLLLKLIHRETGQTTYEILKNYRGSATTFFWSMVASKYDAKLDVTYDPIADYKIEFIIKSAKLE
jgi:hypothetical protein